MPKTDSGRHGFSLQSLLFIILALACADQSWSSGDASTQNPRDCVPACAQGAEESSPISVSGEYFKGYLTDTGNILSAPLRWDSSDWITASCLAGIAAGLYVNDDKIKTWVQEHKNTTTADIAKNAKRLGFASFPALGALYLYGHASGNIRAQKTVLLAIESFVVTGAFVQTLKYAAHRHRPYTGDPHDTWDGPNFNTERGHLSFPSGDASSAFAVAAVVASEYEDTMIVPPLAYGIASLLALGRVHDNGHWSSDVFVGSVAGYVVGRAIVQAHNDEAHERISLSPIMDRRTAGLEVRYAF